MTELANNSIYLKLRRRIRMFWRDHHWAVIWVLALLAFGLGIWGFWKATRPESFNKFLNAFYLTIQLFILESGIVSPPENMNWQLQVARLLAPFSLVLATVAALAALFAEKLDWLWLRFTKNHVVICGLGQKGLLLAKEFKQHSLVVIEKDKANFLIEQCQDLGAHVLVGDATEPDVLSKAKIDRAKYLITICGDEGTNAEIGAQAAKLLSLKREKSFLNCYISIFNSRLWNLLRDRELVLGQGERFGVHYFNIYDSGARMLLKKFPPFSDKNSNQAAPAHIVVIGMGELGECLIVHAAREWWNRYGKSDQRLRITVIDDVAGLRTESLCSQYPQMKNICEFVAKPISVDSAEFHEGAFLYKSKGKCDVSAAYVCMDDDARSLSAALAIFQRIREFRPKIVVCTERDAGLAALLRGVEGNRGEYDILRPFGLFDETCKSDLVLSGINEILARDIHEEYRRLGASRGETTQTNRSMEVWDALPEDIKESNLQQARDINEKLEAVRCAIAPLADWEEEPFEFSSREVEMLAEKEHRRWMKERTSRGYTLGPKNEIKKTNPHLKDWDSLSDEAKDKDRTAVRAVPVMLKKAGFKIYRLQ